MKKIYLMIGLFFWVNMSNPKYNDRHLSILTEEYFKTENLAPELIGHRFYMDENERVFLIDIESTTVSSCDDIYFCFQSLSLLGNLSQNGFQSFIVVLHIPDQILPFVTISNAKCATRFFIDGDYDEKWWRGECLQVKEL